LAAVAGSAYWIMGKRELPPRETRPVETRPVETKPPAVIPAGLALRVERGRHVFRITWNKESPLIQKATNGTLSTSGGYPEKRWTLNSAELRSGYAIRMVQNGDFTFRLTVVSSGKEISELVDLPAGQTLSPPKD